jgi:hypothetical protein
MPHPAALVAAGLLASGPVLAASHTEPVEVGVIVEPVIATDLSHDRPGEDIAESWTWIRAKASQRLANSRWFIGVVGEHHSRWGENLEGTWEARVGESGWAGAVGPLYVSTGVLIERWGKLDLLPVVDVLNPRDLRAGPLTSLEATRIPLAMATLQAGGDHIRAELVLVPFAGSDRVDMVGGDWSLVRPGMLEGFVSEMAQWEGGVGLFLADPLADLSQGLQDAHPSTMRAMGDAMGTAGLPEAIAFNGEAAIRIEADGPGIDGAVMAGALRSHVPAMNMDPLLRTILERGSWPDLDEIPALSSAMSDPITTQWPRTAMVGTELNTATGPLGWRVEGGWWSNTVVQRRWFSSDMSPAIRAAAGVDWAHQTTVFLSLEGRWRHLVSPPPDAFLTRANTIEIAAMVRIATLADRLEIRAAAVVDPELAEYLTRPEIRWRVSDPVELGIGAVLLGGPTAPPQSFTGAMDYTGGPLGYWGDNDCAFATIRWIH